MLEITPCSFFFSPVHYLENYVIFSPWVFNHSEEESPFENKKEKLFWIFFLKKVNATATLVIFKITLFGFENL
jgi:hypothetical protein